MSVHQADVEARAAAERRQTVEVVCAGCGVAYSRHGPGFRWVDPAGPRTSYGAQPPK